MPLALRPTLLGDHSHGMGDLRPTLMDLCAQAAMGALVACVCADRRAKLAVCRAGTAADAEQCGMMLRAVWYDAEGSVARVHDDWYGTRWHRNVACTP